MGAILSFSFNLVNAIGAGSDDGGGPAYKGTDTEGGGGFADDGSTYPGCGIDRQRVF